MTVFFFDQLVTDPFVVDLKGLDHNFRKIRGKQIVPGGRDHQQFCLHGFKGGGKGTALNRQIKNSEKVFVKCSVVATAALA